MSVKTVNVKVECKESARLYLTLVVQDWKSLEITHPKVVKALKLLLELEDILL